MQALILAAGYGKRLGKITKKTPKCLIKINSEPLIDIWLKKLNNLKINKIYINTHYKHQKIINYLRKSAYKKKIILLHEKKLLGTGGTLKKNIKLFKKESLLLLHADNYTEDNLKKFIIFSKKKKSYVSIFAFKTNDFKNSGMIKFDKEKTLTHFSEKPVSYNGNIANGAIFFMKKNFLKYYSKQKKIYDFSKDMIPKLIGKASCYVTKKFFIDVGTQKKLNIVRSKFKNSRYREGYNKLS